MRYASLSVGIVEYAARYYRESTMRLHYAASDATAFHRYIAQAWPGAPGDGHHAVLNNADASAKGLSAAFDSLGSAGQFDVFILYLSGHGEPGNGDGGWFCLADAEPGICSLGGRLLDSLLSQVHAGQVLVLVDCCYAEAAFRHATYFSRLGQGHSRLLIASARANQRAWEDVALGRSIFSDVLLRACSSESQVQDADGVIDVEAALIPYMREQVVLLTAKNKQGQVQEPVTGGLSAMPLKLRSVSGQSFGRSLSLAQTLRARLRRVLVGIGGTALVVFILVHALTFHIVAGSSGQILVRLGLSSTASLLPAYLVRQVDTGFTLSDFDAAQANFFSALSAGAIRGIGTRREELDLKAWIGKIRPALTRPARADFEALVQGQAAKFDPDRDPAPLDQALFVLARTPNVSATRIAAMYPVSYEDVPDCRSDAKARLDFRLLAPSTRVEVDGTLWWAVRTPRQPSEQLAAFETLIARVAYRRVHARESEQAVREMAGLAQAVSLIASQASPQAVVALQKSARALLPTRCGLYAALALGLVSPASEGTQAEALLREEIRGYDRSETGDLATIDQDLAAAALAILAARRPLSPATVDAIAELVGKSGDEIGAGTLAQELLLSIAENQALPPSILVLMQERLHQAHDGVSFQDLGILRVLARNARFLPPARQKEVFALLDKFGASSQGMSDFHEALGFIASALPASKQHVDMLAARLSPATFFPVNTSTYRGEMLISSNGDAAAAALGRIAQYTPVDVDLQERLARLAIGRSDLPHRQELIYGLAHQWYQGPGDHADTVYERLMRTSADAKRRSLETEVACVALAGSHDAVRQRALKNLMTRWAQESEPELRYALARTIARAHYPAMGRMSFCAQH